MPAISLLLMLLSRYIRKCPPPHDIQLYRVPKVHYVLGFMKISVDVKLHYVLKIIIIIIAYSVA
jgi:hypothetical protein